MERQRRRLWTLFRKRGQAEWVRIDRWCDSTMLRRCYEEGASGASAMGGGTGYIPCCCILWDINCCCCCCCWGVADPNRVDVEGAGVDGANSEVCGWAGVWKENGCVVEGAGVDGAGAVPNIEGVPGFAPPKSDDVPSPVDGCWVPSPPNKLLVPDVAPVVGI